MVNNSTNINNRNNHLSSHAIKHTKWPRHTALEIKVPLLKILILIWF